MSCFSTYCFAEKLLFIVEVIHSFLSPSIFSTIITLTVFWFFYRLTWKLQISLKQQDVSREFLWSFWKELDAISENIDNIDVKFKGLSAKGKLYQMCLDKFDTGIAEEYRKDNQLLMAKIHDAILDNQLSVINEFSNFPQQAHQEINSILKDNETQWEDVDNIVSEMKKISLDAYLRIKL